MPFQQPTKRPFSVGQDPGDEDSLTAPNWEPSLHWAVAPVGAQEGEGFAGSPRASHLPLPLLSQDSADRLPGHFLEPVKI